MTGFFYFETSKFHHNFGQNKLVFRQNEIKNTIGPNPHSLIGLFRNELVYILGNAHTAPGLTTFRRGIKQNKMIRVFSDQVGAERTILQEIGVEESQ